MNPLSDAYALMPTSLMPVPPPPPLVLPPPPAPSPPPSYYYSSSTSSSSGGDAWFEYWNIVAGLLSMVAMVTVVRFVYPCSRRDAAHGPAAGLGCVVTVGTLVSILGLSSGDSTARSYVPFAMVIFLLACIPSCVSGIIASCRKEEGNDKGVRSVMTGCACLACFLLFVSFIISCTYIGDDDDDD